MALSATIPFEKYLDTWLAFVQRHVYGFLIILFFITGFSVFYIKNHLGFNTNTTDMLSEKLEWRQNLSRFKHAFPQFSDNIVLVIDSPTPDQTQDAAIALGKRLKAEKDLFPYVFQLRNSDFFRQHNLLFLDTDELEALADNLASVQPFLAKLQQDQTLRGLFSVLTTALDKQDEEVEISPILDAIDKTVSAGLQNKSERMSWHELMSGRKSTVEDRQAIITLQPRLDFSKLQPGEPAIETIRKIIHDMRIEQRYGVRVRLTGEVALSYEELDSVTRGAQKGGFLALVAVTVILITGLQSFTLVIVTLITLVTGLIWTTAFAAFAVGELNMISIAFMVLYIGLGVDFSIHLCLRYREQRLKMDQPLAIRESGKHIGTSLLLCAVTTAIGFYAFLPTAYSGVAELGLIAGTGMFISLFLSLSLLPALLTILPYQPQQPIHAKSRSYRWIQTFPVKHAKSILVFSLIIGVLCLATLPKIKFDHNPVHLMDPKTESVQTYLDLLKKSSYSPLSISIVTRAINDFPDHLKALETVDDVVTLESFIPEDQTEKLSIIEDLALVMSLDDKLQQKPVTDRERLQAIREFAQKLKTMHPRHPLNHTLDRLLHADSPNLEKLEQALLASLPGRIQNLRLSLEADRIDKNSLPRDLRDRWISKRDQLYRIEVFPKVDLDNNVALEHFVSEVRSIAPDSTGTPVINLEASKAVIKAFQQAFLLAITAITLLLWLLLDRKTDTFLVLFPLALAGLLTCAFSVWFNIPFNFANIIALPLLLGIGVDSAVHILHRYRTELPESGLLLDTSTARGVLFSALTTACSFGNLAISPHRGTASMGILLTIGLILTLIVTLIVLPALLAITDRKT